MMNIKCKGEGHKIIRPFDSFGNEKEWCSTCLGSGFSDAKILAYVKEHTLENVVAGCRIVESLLNEEIYIMRGMGAVEMFEGKICVDNEDEKGLQRMPDLNAALDVLLGEEEEG